jgi:Sec-independent protein translocase protein TatA
MKMNTALIKPEWSFVTIALMVLGFIMFWPLGLAVLAYIIWGEKFGGSADKAGDWINKNKSRMSSCKSHKGKGYKSSHHSTGNAAFDEYRQEQMKRLNEERQRLDEEINEFHDYMRHLHMARDREEFDRFINERKRSSKDVTSDTSTSDDGQKDRGYTND